MKIKINGKFEIFSGQITITDLLEKLEISDDIGCAVALNRSVIPSKSFNSTYIKDGDELEIIHATAGG